MRLGGGSASGRWQLEDRGCAPATEETAGRDVPADLDHPAIAIQEEQVKRESHPKRVNTPTGGDQQPGPSSVPLDEGQAEQSAHPGRRDWDVEAEEPPAFTSSESAEFRLHIYVSAGGWSFGPAVPASG
jgi:hypothetical protein